MDTTDSPLKRLVSTFITDFAAWLTEAEVRAAYPLPNELPGEARVVDQVFHVTLADGRALVLHIEFQGRGSYPPMRWRMLEYMARLAQTHRLDLWSVVLYVGRGVGARDTGYYQVNGPDDTPTLTWRYRIIRLWQMPAEDLLAAGRPALLALVGQTQIAQPAVLLPQVVTRLRSVPDIDMRGRLLADMVALLSDQETVDMVEKLLDREELLLDTPFLRRIREEGREEGRQEGREEGRQAAREAAREAREAREAGRVEGRRHSILEALALRFDPPVSVYQQVERYLANVTDESRLEALFAVAVRGESLADFQAAMGHA
jgi:predicted transposase YdaD